MTTKKRNDALIMNTELPKNWKWVKLGEICDKISLNKLKIQQKDYLQEGKYPVVDQGQELIGGFFNNESLIVPNEPPFIIFGDHTKVKKYITFKFIAGADGIKVLKAKANINPKFFYYSLFTVKIEDKGYARHFQFLEKADFPLPPLPEQHRIVAKLEELLSELEKGKEQLHTALDQLKVYRQAVLKYAFEGKLTNKNVKEGDLPKGWKWVKLGEIIESMKNGIYKPANIYSDDGIACLRMYNIDSGKIKWFDIKRMNLAKEDIKEYRLLDGDLLVNRVNSRELVGKTAVIRKRNEPIVYESKNIRVRLKNGFNSEYVNYWFLLSANKYFNRNAQQTVGMASINQQQISNFNIPLCESSEQNTVVEEIESRLSVADKLEETITASLQQSETLRQSILKKAFEGKLV